MTTEIIIPMLVWTMVVLLVCFVASAMMEMHCVYRKPSVTKQYKAPTVEEVADTRSDDLLRSRDVYRIFDNDGNVIQVIQRR